MRLTPPMTHIEMLSHLYRNSCKPPFPDQTERHTATHCWAAADASASFPGIHVLECWIARSLYYYLFEHPLTAITWLLTLALTGRRQQQRWWYSTWQTAQYREATASSTRIWMLENFKSMEWCGSPELFCRYTIDTTRHNTTDEDNTEYLNLTELSTAARQYVTRE